MSDHIAEVGKMVSDKVVMLRTIAAILDHPSVYMGGPSQRNMRRAEEIYAAVAPLIAKAERERCARVLEAWADSVEAKAPKSPTIIQARNHAAAIRSLGDADG